ncbi:hypothetical protein O181_112033 [Austropuccinia psidii MF-1]|uniref:Uncharacterized protein n=1 Tax=Austropuccinia psidii MF-1 TaxID=1389203 RepID=A0A9Q3JZP2_9BASI|nr:hypothetical protein [Austropuccinia psidii MF-1]
MNIIQLKKDYRATAIAKVENWGIWQPPTISSANEPCLTNYGLRNTKERNSRAENTNKESLRSHSKVKKPINKRPNIPGAYIEDEQKEEEKTIIPTKYKKPQLEKMKRKYFHRNLKLIKLKIFKNQSRNSRKEKLLRKKN